MNPRPWTQSSLLLVLALAAGAALGAALPFRLTWLHAAGQAYLNVLNMVALPLIVLAVASGLRQARARAGTARRLAWLPLAALLAMALFAWLGAALADLFLAGSTLAPQQAAALGQLALQSEPPLGIDLLGAEAVPAGPWTWEPLVTDNPYRALAYGTLASGLVGVVFFGLALAVQETGRSRAWLALADGAYRSLETLVERFNRWLPFFLFALAAATVNALDAGLVQRMQGFLLPFALSALCAAVLAVAVIALRLRQPVSRVLDALRIPVVVCLFSSGPAAAVPSLIDAMCNRLGFRRDLMELAAPLLPAFLRVGDAVFFAVLAVFVAHLYAQPLSTADWLVIAAAASAAALAGVAWASGWSLAAGGLLLGWLDLPFEALLPAFVLLEAVTAGARTLVSVLAVAPLLALVAGGLLPPPPRVIHAARTEPAPRYAVALPRRQAVALASLLVLALLLACLAGIGVGLRTGVT